MAWVKVLRKFVGEANATDKKGEVIEVTDAYAKSLIEFGYAVAAPAPASAVIKKETL